MATRAELEIEESAERTELTVRGSADVAAAAALHERLVDAVTGTRDVVVKLDAVERMDGAGLQLFVSLKKTVESAGRKCLLAFGDGAARRAAEVVGLWSVLGAE